ncbi:MAG TPA: transcriptional regulator, partial [Pyrinomonadaceae bacterium]|nr:transcriptional regulator [Pyrinomonadaceae bacterium]
MYNGHNGLRQFGNCRLDVGNKLLWFGDEPVHIPPKAVEVLCLLVERHGAVVSKDEIWNEVWPDAFVEETNLTHNIYLLRKTLNELGERDLIQTVPRRGYRFAGNITEDSPGDVILERHTSTQTLIEIQE